MDTIVRERNLEALLDTMNPYLPIVGLDPAEWLLSELNVALTDGKGNYGLFERSGNGLVSGHYFMKTRGRDALRTAKVILHEAFTGPYDIQVIRGFTPLEKLGARWMNKQLGFTGYGVITTNVGPMELVILTKKEWEQHE